MIHGITPILVLLLFGMLTAVAPAAQPPKMDGDTFSRLKEKLKQDGFDAERIDSLYGRPGVRFEVDKVSLYFAHSEARLNYDQFAEPGSVQKARRYMEAHAAVLDRVEREYGVDRTVITAIILVETRLGTIVGNTPILNILSTMAALENEAVRQDFWQILSATHGVTRDELDRWVGRKSGWAYGELKAFLEYTGRQDLDPSAVSGSYAGALGISQFMPSNILAHARDGDGDGRIDLFTHADAIESIANFLRHHGWRPGMAREKAIRVLYRYNYSSPYAQTILKVSSLLKGGS